MLVPMHEQATMSSDVHWTHHLIDKSAVDIRFGYAVLQGFRLACDSVLCNQPVESISGYGDANIARLILCVGSTPSLDRLSPVCTRTDAVESLHCFASTLCKFAVTSTLMQQDAGERYKRKERDQL